MWGSIPTISLPGSCYRALHIFLQLTLPLKYCFCIHLKFVRKLNRVVSQLLFSIHKSSFLKKGSILLRMENITLCVWALLSVNWTFFSQPTGKWNTVSLEGALIQVLFPAGIQLFSTTRLSNSNGSALCTSSCCTASWESLQQLTSFYQRLELPTW